MDKFEGRRCSVMESSRRPRARCNTASCAVDGCRSDLSRSMDYHRRHKVCEAHSKTPTVTVGGHEMRFCQQCSRFHSLAEFDGGKRSCRKRLDGHNRRRRKPRPESLILNHACFLSTHQGASARHLPLGLPQACPAPVDPSCALGNGALSLLSLPLPHAEETQEVGFKNYMVQLPRPHSSIPTTLYCNEFLLQAQSRGSFSMQDCSDKVVNESSFQPVALDRFIR